MTTAPDEPTPATEPDLDPVQPGEDPGVPPEADDPPVQPH